MSQKTKDVLLTIGVLVIFFIGYCVYSYNNDISAIKNGTFPVDRSITMEIGLNNYFGNNGDWSMDGDIVTYISPDGFTTIEFRRYDEGKFSCEKIFFSDGGVYYGTDAQNYLFTIFANYSEGYAQYTTSTSYDSLW